MPPDDTDHPLPPFPGNRAARCPFDPPAALSALQAESPLARVRLWDGSAPWLVTRHAQQRALLTDPRISADVMRPGYPHVNEGFRKHREALRTFVNMDDPEHARIRRMIISPFAARRVEALRPDVQRIAEDLISGLLAGPRPVDLVAALAVPVPLLVICRLLGVPDADREFFRATVESMTNPRTPPTAARAALAELHGYLDGLISRKLADPADDLLSFLATGRLRAGELSRQELASTAIVLLLSGHETTANMISLGTLALLCHPAQLAVLRDADDPELVAGAVEELLRYLTIAHFGRRRVALADVEIDGQVIRAGEGVIMATDLANRDGSVFGDPGRLDLRRDARQHMAFGFGAHQCLGQSLARLELQAVFGTLYRRVPTLSLAVRMEDVEFKHDSAVSGLAGLPVTW
jgi:cytochrome P450